MILHKGYGVSGAMVIQTEDGKERRLGAGDAYVIEPGHDAWVVGDEVYVGSTSPSRWRSTKPKE